MNESVHDSRLYLVMFFAAVVSIVSFNYFYQQDLVTAFGDAQARLMIARQVIDSPNPGLPQLGGIWLPLPQVAMLPFIWQDKLFHEGTAGSLVSMASYILACIFLYKLILHFTKSRTASLIGVLAFSTPDILFMQSVPMAEMPFIASMIASFYTFSRWIQEPTNVKWLRLTAIALFICSLTRYEGWILLAIMSTIAWISFRNNRISYRKSEDLFFLFITIAAYGVVLWLAWNQLIFGDFLYFNRSTYAPWAIAQNALKSMDPSQKTSGDILLSLKVYGKTVLDNAGYLTSLLAMLGIFFFGVTKMNSSEKLTGLSLLFPFIFYVGALFLGFSVVIWHPSFTDGGNWGTRYGTFMMPAVGFFVAYLASKQKQAIQFVIAILVIISSVMSWNDGIISAGEAISNRDNPDAVTQRVAGEWFDQNYDRGLVLMQRFGNETFIFSSSVPLKKLVYEGSQEDFWNSTLNNPYESHVDWIVMRQRFEEPDTVWESLIDSQIVRDNYHIEYQAPGIIIYKINNPSS